MNKIVFGGKTAQNVPGKEIPSYLIGKQKHTIQDSGLFTLMFGSKKGKKDEALMNRWYDALVEFTLENSKGATCVEVDCQKVLGVEKAWEFRERMKRDLPNNRIINVFHLEDGQKGLDRLIEFSEYIAISVPELRYAGKKEYVPHIANYIKSKKPSIDIHLLGCTEIDIIKKCTFCTSCDSTSFLQGRRYGFVNGNHIRRIKTEEVIKLVGQDTFDICRIGLNEKYACAALLDVYRLMNKYQSVCGNQDYNT